VSPNLERISVKARANPDLVFTSLYHHIADIEHLRACYRMLNGNKAVGVDEVTKSMYAEELETNLQDLAARLKRMGYRPQPKLRVYIPKPGSEQGRALGISSFEDKIVELATKRVVEPLFESLFEECSYGYRPERSPHQCLDALGRTIQQERVNHPVEADIRGFFNAVDHNWLLKFLRQRIGDNRVLRLISRMLKAGIMEEGRMETTEVGTPQGSILSPLLSNVYLHYVLDIWFQRRVRRHCRGTAFLFRFADDFLACFQYQTDAEAFLESLRERMAGFHLELAEEKTRHLECGRYARANAYQRGEKPQEFTFLGMTFFCGKTRHGAFKVKRKTSRKQLQQSLARLTDWIRRYRNLLPTGDLLRQAKMRIQGHLNY
jgi:RNA-directed DNA polymerase